MIPHKTHGYLLGAGAAACNGLNPLFALPLFAAGVGVDSVLFHRYLVAAVLLGGLMFARGHSFKLRRCDLVPMTVMGLLFAFSSLFLFSSYRYIDAGIASTILFIYPVLVAIIMALFYREKGVVYTALSIVLALAGIAMLYNGGSQALNTMGVGLVLTSSLCYAVYIVGVGHTSLSELPSEKIAFYVTVCGIAVYGIRTHLGMDLQAVPTDLWVNVVSLALFPTVLSLVSMAAAIRIIGSTPAAILGTLEPVTALFIGVIVFGEEITMRSAAGVLLVFASVAVVILGKSGHLHLAHLPSYLRIRKIG